MQTDDTSEQRRCSLSLGLCIRARPHRPLTSHRPHRKTFESSPAELSTSPTRLSPSRVDSRPPHLAVNMRGALALISFLATLAIATPVPLNGVSSRGVPSLASLDSQPGQLEKRQVFVTPGQVNAAAARVDRDAKRVIKDVRRTQKDIRRTQIDANRLAVDRARLAVGAIGVSAAAVPVPVPVPVPVRRVPVPVPVAVPVGRVPVTVPVPVAVPIAV